MASIFGLLLILVGILIIVLPDLLAYFVVGPMVVGPREDRAKFRERVSASGTDAQAVWNLILSLKPYTFSGIHSLLSLLEEVGTSLVQFAYQANQLAAIVPSGAKVDQAVASYGKAIAIKPDWMSAWESAS